MYLQSEPRSFRLTCGNCWSQLLHTEQNKTECYWGEIGTQGRVRLLGMHTSCSCVLWWDVWGHFCMAPALRFRKMLFFHETLDSVYIRNSECRSWPCSLFTKAARKLLLNYYPVSTLHRVPWDSLCVHFNVSSILPPFPRFSLVLTLYWNLCYYIQLKKNLCKVGR